MVPFSFRGMWVGGDKVPNWENDIVGDFENQSWARSEHKSQGGRVYGGLKIKANSKITIFPNPIFKSKENQVMKTFGFDRSKTHVVFP